jgi:hypothetical protein
VLDIPADESERHDDDDPADEHRDGMANGKARDRRDQRVSARNPLRKGQRPPISSVTG